MPKLTRYIQKVFGKDAGPTELKKFGSLAAGTPANATNPKEVQELAKYTNGWPSAILGGNSPAIEDRNSLDYLFSYQLAYLLERGIPEWDAETSYYIGAIVQSSATTQLYRSISNDNLNNSLNDDLHWESMFQPIIDAQISNTKRAVTHWEPVGSGDNVSTNKVIWVEELGKFIAVGDGTISNQIKVSADGWNWKYASSSADIIIDDVVWSPELSLLVGVSKTVNATNIITSPDGFTWTRRSVPESAPRGAVVWAKELGLFVTVGNGIGSTGVMTSPDGITWTTRTQSIARNWASLTWAPEIGLLVAGSSSSASDLGRIMTSPDGINWTSQTSTIDQSYEIMAWSNHLQYFISLPPDGSSGNYVKSSDGITWTTHFSPSLPPEAKDLIYNPDSRQFVMCKGGNNESGDISDFVASSDFGTDWKVYTMDTGIFMDTNANILTLAWSKKLSTYVGMSLNGNDIASR